MSKIQELLTGAGIENPELQVKLEKLIDESGSGMTEKEANFKIMKALTQRDEAKGNLLEKEVEINGLNEKIKGFKTQLTELGKYKTQVEEITASGNAKNLEKWNSRKPLFEAKEGDKLFDKVSKVKHRFALGDDLTPDQINTNLGILETYDEVEYFKGEDDSTGYDSGKPGKHEKKTEEKSPFEGLPSS